MGFAVLRCCIAVAIGFVLLGDRTTPALALGTAGRLEAFNRAKLNADAMRALAQSKAAMQQGSSSVAFSAHNRVSPAVVAASKTPPKPGVPLQPLIPLAVQAPTSSVMVRAMDETDTDAQAFAAMYPTMNNSAVLLKEMDESQTKIHALRVKKAEKENFLDELQVKEEMLRSDVKKDAVAIFNLEAHVSGLHARLEKIKRESELEMLADKYNEINVQGQKLKNQVHEINNVKDALYNKMADIHSDIVALRDKENHDLRRSINVDESDNDSDGSSDGSVVHIVHTTGPQGSRTVGVVSGGPATAVIGNGNGGHVVVAHPGPGDGRPAVGVLAPFGVSVPPHIV
mmetsp:Transcript_27734/g.40981  ORF Transcript_27734/g.40981 Transcript_27734/m.40981 type:complete len:342 (-) Transcript_27734:8-1033(-)